MRRFAFFALGVGLCAWVPTDAHARPVAPQAFCEFYGGSPWCAGQAVGCEMCHTSTGPAAWNTYGEAVRAELPAGLDNEAFIAELPTALAAIENDDLDGDGFDNLDEINGGSLPFDEASTPGDLACPEDVSELAYPICQYSRRHVFRKVHLDFCGVSPDYDELLTFMQLSEADQDAALHAALDTCLQTEFWRGKNGFVWKMAHDKIRPVGALKAGEDEVPEVVDLADYYNDYNLFVWSHIDGHDVRSLLTADFHVERDTSPTTYTQVQDVTPACGACSEPMQIDRRAGMITTRWFTGYFIMFTPLPRAAAAQAYRAYLGHDIAKSEGLDHPIDGEPVDYDDKGVDAETCAVCHSTLDPLTYAFRNYNGITGDRHQYQPNRLYENWPDDPTDLHDTPEAGYILGQPYDDLNQWAQIAADSDDFVIAIVEDYWRRLIGRAPLPTESAEFEALWTSLAGEHAYSVEAMLHDFIMTEAYGAP
jgi:hypothetical protein